MSAPRPEVCTFEPDEYLPCSPMAGAMASRPDSGPDIITRVDPYTGRWILSLVGEMTTRPIRFCPFCGVSLP